MIHIALTPDLVAARQHTLRTEAARWRLLRRGPRSRPASCRVRA